jgi:hypothetical protein
VIDKALLNQNEAEEVGIAVAYLIHIREVLNSVVGRLLTVLAEIFLLFSPFSPDKC